MEVCRIIFLLKSNKAEVGGTIVPPKSSKAEVGGSKWNWVEMCREQLEIRMCYTEY